MTTIDSRPDPARTANLLAVITERDVDTIPATSRDALLAAIHDDETGSYCLYCNCRTLHPERHIHPDDPDCLTDGTDFAEILADAWSD